MPRSRARPPRARRSSRRVRPGRWGAPKELERLSGAAARDLGGGVIVVDRRGRLVADSAGEGLVRASYAGRPEVATALRGRTAQGTRRSESLDQDLLYTAVPIMRGPRPAGAVRVDSERRRGAVGDALGRACPDRDRRGGVWRSAWRWPGSSPIRSPAAARPRGRCARRGRRGPATAGRRGGLSRAAGGGSRVQRHDDARRACAELAAGLRRERVASAPHPADRIALAAGVGGAQVRGPGRAPRHRGGRA